MKSSRGSRRSQGNIRLRGSGKLTRYLCNYVPWLIALISICLNILLISIDPHSPDNFLNPDTSSHSHPIKSQSIISPIVDAPLPTINANGNANANHKCNIVESMQNTIYVYDLPFELREQPTRDWYKMFYRQQWNDATVNYGFGQPMNGSSDYYYTHMHSLETIINERMKEDSHRYITDDPSKAALFYIPFAFAQNYRSHHGGDGWPHVEAIHQKLQNWLNNNEVYQTYFDKRMHFVLFGRIAYETGQFTRRQSPFWDDERYYVASVDRNCHGDVVSCHNRFSMPHPSVYHPTSVQSLKSAITRAKEAKREILVSFCGAVRTPTRKAARDICNSVSKNAKWKAYYSGRGTMCSFVDSLDEEKVMKDELNLSGGERKRRLELKLSEQCMGLYTQSEFCIQEGADSTTRKGLWDGMVAGCIPVFLHGVMSAEFECYGDTNHPWFVVLHPDYYVKQLMALPRHYIDTLRNNVLKMVPKLIYTNGKAGFNDAFDVIFTCMARFAHHASHPQICTSDEMIQRKWNDFDHILDYPRLYQQLDL